MQSKFMECIEKTRDELYAEIERLKSRIQGLTLCEGAIAWEYDKSLVDEIFDTSPVGLALVKDQKIVWMNEAGRQTLGHVREEDPIGRTLESMFASEEELSSILMNFSDKTSGELTTSAQLMREGGSIFHARIKFRVRSDKHSRADAIIAFSEIVQCAEEALRATEERDRILVSESLVGTYIHQDGAFVYLNDYLPRILGWEKEEMLGRNFWDFVHPEDRELVKERGLARSLGFPVPPHYVFKVICKNRETRWLELYATSVTYRGRPASMGNVLDITKRKEAEAALRHSEEKYRMMFEHSPLGIFHFDQNAVITACNENFVNILGSSKEKLVGLKLLADLKDPLMVESVRKTIKYESAYYEGYYRSVTSGKKVPVQCHFAGISDENGAFIGGIGIVEDITDRKKYEQTLAAEKERLEVTLRSIGDGVITTDTEGRIVLMNRVAEGLTGWLQFQAQGKRLGEVFTIVNERTRELFDDPVKKVLETGKIVGLENHAVLIAKDKTERLVEDSGAPICDAGGNILGVVLVFRDVTEEQKIETELQKMEKLESIGILAGGIAHDFNNILTALAGNIALAKMHMHASDNPFKKLTEAEKAITRARDLTQQLLTFSKGGAPIKASACIADIVKDSCAFALMGSKVKSELHLQDGLWTVEVDKGQISQVINNLIINANQAMPMGGTITVRIENETLAEEIVSGLKPGRYVKILIQDQGIGIPEDHLNRIFDPYFTTKPEGSGLGLATSYSIVKKHDGLITVESEIEFGTTFSIYLPASEARKQRPQHYADSVHNTGKGRILIMDDEEAIRNLTREMLLLLGYDVVLAKDGAQAIKLYADMRDGHPFSAVIMDLTVPGGIGGCEALKVLKQIDPNIKAIVSSGYSNDPVMADYAGYGFCDVMAKPYTLNDLAETLQRVIGDRDC